VDGEAYGRRVTDRLSVVPNSNGDGRAALAGVNKLTWAIVSALGLLVMAIATLLWNQTQTQQQVLSAKVDQILVLESNRGERIATLEANNRATDARLNGIDQSVRDANAKLDRLLSSQGRP